MKVAFEEIGRVAATFAAEGVKAGTVCKMTGDGTVAPCADGENFVGLVENVRKDFCGVRLHGFAQVSYTGAAPGVGYVNLAANGGGGVKVSSGGRAHLVVCVDENAMQAVIEL
jgi:hypothetical protein